MKKHNADLRLSWGRHVSSAQYLSLPGSSNRAPFRENEGSDGTSASRPHTQWTRAAASVSATCNCRPSWHDPLRSEETVQVTEGNDRASTARYDTQMSYSPVLFSFRLLIVCLHTLKHYNRYFLKPHTPRLQICLQGRWFDKLSKLLTQR